MNYEPTTWKDGDLVTSAKLNKIEQGIANSSGSSGSSVEFLELNTSNNPSTLNKTAEEIIQSINSGKLLYLRINMKGTLLFCQLIEYGTTEEGFDFGFLFTTVISTMKTNFHANDSSEYPAMESQQQ